MCFPSGLQQAEIQTTIEMTEEGISDQHCCKINIVARSTSADRQQCQPQKSSMWFSLGNYPNRALPLLTSSRPMSMIRIIAKQKPESFDKRGDGTDTCFNFAFN
jgi:hypothetical protein